MNAKCDVIVLTWNQLNTIKEFVESFLSKTRTPCRLAIIDNGSKDGTKNYLKDLQGTDIVKIKVILNNENKGFVGGMNQGIEASRAPYVCLANNDLTFTEGWMEEVISVFENNEKIGVLNPNSNSLGLQVPKGKELDEFANELKDKNKGQFIQMPFCIGYCMFIRKEVIEKIGGLSEEFMPIFFEDTDYSLKAQKAGFLIGVAKGSYVLHQEHAAFSKKEKKKEQLFRKSKKTFTKKWGKILRVAWIAKDYNELLENLDKGLSLAKEGNFVWFFIKDFNKEKKEVFKEHGSIEHAGVNFISYNNGLDLFWKIIKKKKRYQPIINIGKFTGFFLKLLGHKVIDNYNYNRVKKIKFS
jgi:GT2 family glycosyltransferase